MNKSKEKFFSDLDDTITSNSCLFYSKIKFYIQFNKSKNIKTSFFAEILKDFKINNDFLKVIKKFKIREVFILSRNDDSFIKYFVYFFNKNYSSIYGFKIIGGIGGINTEKKMEYIDGKGILISDIFEYKKLKKYNNFISVDKYSIFKKYFILGKKCSYFILFLFKQGLNIIKKY